MIITPVISQGRNNDIRYRGKSACDFRTPLINYIMLMVIIDGVTVCLIRIKIK